MSLILLLSHFIKNKKIIFHELKNTYKGLLKAMNAVTDYNISKFKSMLKRSFYVFNSSE